jgi:autotransporter passenger strand-loop-strand repeat protein
VRSGGEEIVFDGGSSSRTVISSGGVEIVSSGGVAVTAKVLQGGKVIVAAGGAIAVGLNINGGVAVIRGAAITGQAVKFMGTSGTLEIDSVSEFRTKISGFDAPN